MYLESIQFSRLDDLYLHWPTCPYRINIRINRTLITGNYGVPKFSSVMYFSSIIPVSSK